MTSFAEWMKLEKCWMASYRRKMLKTTVFVTLPLTALVLGGLMPVTGLMYDGFLPETAGLFLTGAGAGAFRPEQEYKTATTVRAKSSTVTGFTLYTICFYSREQVAAGLAADTPADAADISGAEQQLGVRFPQKLRGLLREMDGDCDLRELPFSAWLDKKRKTGISSVLEPCRTPQIV